MKWRWIQPFKGMEPPIICPRFWKLQFAYGCPLDCHYCYLLGTYYRQSPYQHPPTYYKDMTLEAFRNELLDFFDKTGEPQLLNTGELADSTMFEGQEFFGASFSNFIIPLFERQRRHKVLFLTKIANISNIVEIPNAIGKVKQTIMSFSMNPPEVAREANETQNISHRIESAKRCFESGYEIRMRIDPMIPIPNWRLQYKNLIDEMFDAFIPQRITLGSLRINNPRLPSLRPRFWNVWKPRMIHLGRGKYRFPPTLDREMYSHIIDLLDNKGYNGDIALCKELVEVWDGLDLDYRSCKCNCVL